MWHFSWVEIVAVIVDILILAWIYVEYKNIKKHD